MPFEKAPNRAPAGRDTLPAQSRYDFDQYQIWLLLNQAEYGVCVLLQWRNAAPRWLWRSTSAIFPVLKPFNSRARAYLKAFGCFSTRRACFNSFDHALTQVLRIRSWHRPAPAANTESMAGTLPQSQLLGNPLTQDSTDLDSKGSGNALGSQANSCSSAGVVLRKL
jgi:hypothetical protein